MKSKLITILLGVCIIPFTLFTVACSDTNEIEKLQMYISELMEDVDKLEERILAKLTVNIFLLTVIGKG